jgi:hypothetical protein
MRWRRHTDYHGSREYESDRAGNAPIGNLTLAFAWILYTARCQLERLLRPTLPPSTAMLPNKAHRTGFTVLGSANDRLPRRGSASAACPFPERSDPHNGRNVRTRVQ